MDALRVEIGDVRRDVLAELMIDADAGLHVERGVEVRIDGVVGGDGGGGRGQNGGGFGGVGIVETGIVDGVAFLIDEIVVDGLDDVGRAPRR